MKSHFILSALLNAYYVQGAKDTNIHKIQSLPSVCSLEKTGSQMCKQKITTKLDKSHWSTYMQDLVSVLRVKVLEWTRQRRLFEESGYALARLFRARRTASAPSLSPHTTLRLFSLTWCSSVLLTRYLETSAAFMIALIHCLQRFFAHSGLSCVR